MSAAFTNLTIGAFDRKDDSTRVELWRSVNSVGRFKATLRNLNGAYNNSFDIQYEFRCNVDGNQLFQGRVDGPGVKLVGSDGESIWDEYIVVQGVDLAQDLLFHDDFDYNYPDINQEIQTVINDIFNVQLDTNITYAPPGGITPTVGSVEWREGNSFLSTLQEAHRRAEYVFYVDDALQLRSGPPVWFGSGYTAKSVAGATDNTVLGRVDLQERDGGKLYNYVKLYGKNPMFDAYSERNASSWTTTFGNMPLTDDTTQVRVGSYSTLLINVLNVEPYFEITLPKFNYTSWDLSKGELGCWIYYTGGSTNTTWRFQLFDDLGQTKIFYSGPYGIITSNINRTRSLQNVWSWISVPIGKDVSSGGVAVTDSWWPTNNFNWNNVVRMRIQAWIAGTIGPYPATVRMDGLTLPIPTIAISEDAAQQASYRKRPYIDHFQHLTTQNAIQGAAEQLLNHHKYSNIDKISLTVIGDPSLRYAGQTFQVNIPSLGLTGDYFYITELHHIIEPHVDVSDGYGRDWITRIEGVPTSGVIYDRGRLDSNPVYSSRQVANRDGSGLRLK